MTKFKAFLLLAILSIMLVYLGRLIAGPGGMTFALIMAGLINFISYWYSDKIVLRMYSAREVAPSENPQLHQIVEDLAARANIKKPKVYVIPSEHPNAFATGRNPNNASIAVTEGILKLLSYEELRGVLAHEISHIKNYDILIGTIAATIAGAITYLSYMFRWVAIFGIGDDDDRGNVLVALLISILAPLAAMIVQLAISRQREYLADETGAKLIGDPTPLANALKKLAYGTQRVPMRANPATQHLFIVAPLKGGGLLTLFSTHPPIEKRIERLMSLKFGVI